MPPVLTHPQSPTYPAHPPARPAGSFEPACGRTRLHTKYSRGYLKEDGKTLVIKKIKSMAACCEECKNVVRPRAARSVFKGRTAVNVCRVLDAAPCACHGCCMVH